MLVLPPPPPPAWPSPQSGLGCIWRTSTLPKLPVASLSSQSVGTGPWPASDGQPCSGSSNSGKGSGRSDRALEMKAAVFAFPKCRCVPGACSFLCPAGVFFFFFPVPLSDILRGKLPALTGGLLFSFFSKWTLTQLRQMSHCKNKQIIILRFLKGSSLPTDRKGGT